MPFPRLAQTAEQMVYRVAGLPVATRVLFERQRADTLHLAFAKSYWKPGGVAAWCELIGAIILSPLALLGSCAWFTARNGRIIRQRYGKRISAQVVEQLRFYLSSGVLPPWYYIFSLHEDGARRAPTFIHRFETKTCYFKLLKRRKGSPLNDKSRFAQFCTEHGIPAVETVMTLSGEPPGIGLPDEDLFVKPVAGRGGRGAERWDRVDAFTFAGPRGEQLSASGVLARLVARSRNTPLLVQRRMRPHPDLVPLTAGALPTLRVLTCLNERAEPEVAASMMRTSFGKNRTVDNLHAGGIGALVHVTSGTLSRASNLGANARLGWFSVHPDTGAPIEGEVVPCWEDVKALAVRAHRHFNDRVVIGWDIAVLERGPILIEGNGNPDLDILQRFMHLGLREHRFASLLAYHLRLRGLASSSSMKTPTKGC